MSNGRRCEECGSRTRNGCGAEAHDSLPETVEGGCPGHGITEWECRMCALASPVQEGAEDARP
jgi:hypothetical protein